METKGLSKESAGTLYGVAYNFYNHAKYDQAEHFFRFLSMLDPSAAKHWIGLGAALQMQKKYDQAIEAYICASLLDEAKESPLPPFYVAQCYFSQGKVEQALKALDGVEENIKDNIKFSELLSRIVFMRERWMEVK